MRIQAIESFDSPELAPYRTLRYQREHRRDGIFVSEGENAVQRFIDSALEMVSLVVPEHLLENYKAPAAARGGEIPLYVAPKKLLETLTGFPMCQGVMAVGKAPAPIQLESFLERAPRPLFETALAGDCRLVTVSEGPGLRSETIAQCDKLVSIPMPAEIVSLNVASASAVFLHEAARRRKARFWRRRL